MELLVLKATFTTNMKIYQLLLKYKSFHLTEILGILYVNSIEMSLSQEKSVKPIPRRNKEEFGSLNLKVDGFSIMIVNMLEKTETSYYVTEDTTVLDVKKKITEETGVNTDIQQLIFHGRKMDEEELLFYTLVERDRVVLVGLEENLEERFKLLVFFEDGTETAIEVSNDSSILRIKQKISLIREVKAQDMMLMKDGKKLEDNEVVGFYGMKEWDMLMLRVYRKTTK